MFFDKAIIKMLKIRTGCDVTTPSGAAFLRNDIESVTGESLALNTVKRLTGVLPCDSTPRATTLDIVARFLGYNSWNILMATIESHVSNFNVPEGFIDLPSLSVGQLVQIEWEPDRKIIMRHEGNGKYTVVSALNSKLLEGDKLHLSQIAHGFPFLVREVIRAGNSLGPYTAASETGLHSAKIL